MHVIFTQTPTSIEPANSKMSFFRIVGELRLDLVDPGTSSVTEIVIPTRFQTDFASVPRPFRSLIPPMGRYSWATVVHDYLLREGHDRDFCRRVLVLCMEELEVKLWRRTIITFGVYVYDKVGVRLA